MSSSCAISLCVLCIFVFVSYVDCASAKDVKCSDSRMCPEQSVCKIDVGLCFYCNDICNPSLEEFSESSCTDLCAGYEKIKSSNQPMEDTVDMKDKSKIRGTHIVATMLNDDEIVSVDFNIQENKESNNTVLSLGDMAAICGVIAFIIFCIGLRILTKEYPCPWFISPKNTKPIKLEENNEELTELNIV